MCGFVAIYESGGRKVQSHRDLLQKMCDVIIHRGPNHFGAFEDEYVSLGHRRLSIIDLSDQANQPMVREGYAIVYNGEIYNYLEIRKDLEKKYGSIFQTRSDTEVILEAYVRLGPECIKLFNGMFAFVIWDSLKKTLFVARDRLGVKPLFFARDGNRYCFASDLKSLWETISLSGRLNERAVENYFSQGFISEEESSTRGIYKFPSAEYWCLEEGKEEKKQYWDLNRIARRQDFSFTNVVLETEDLLKDAVKLRLRSDVPVGCFLSGGVDSSLISALVARELPASFHTYSIGFDSPDHDESIYAYQVATRYGTKHHHIRLDDSCLDCLPQIVWHYSELFGDASAVPTYFVSQFAKEGLTVVLTGDGADEAFGGYVDPFAVYLAQYYRKIPSGVKALLAPLRGISKNGGSHYLLRWLRRFHEISCLDSEAVYENFKSGSWNGYVQKGGFSIRHFRACRSNNEVDRFIFADIQERLCFDFLVKVDMATMAHSLEARSPFLDYRLIELGYSLEHRLRYRHFRRKAVLKAIAEKYVDRANIHRKKMGFSIPQSTWLRSPRWRKIVRQIVTKRTILHSFLSAETIEEVLSQFERGNDHHANRIWLVLWFQIWEGLFLSRTYQANQRLSELAI